MPKMQLLTILMFFVATCGCGEAKSVKDMLPDGISSSSSKHINTPEYVDLSDGKGPIAEEEEEELLLPAPGKTGKEIPEYLYEEDGGSKKKKVEAEAEAISKPELVEEEEEMVSKPLAVVEEVEVVSKPMVVVEEVSKPVAVKEVPKPGGVVAGHTVAISKPEVVEEEVVSKPMVVVEEVSKPVATKEVSKPVAVKGVSKPGHPVAVVKEKGEVLKPVAVKEVLKPGVVVAGHPVVISKPEVVEEEVVSKPMVVVEEVSKPVKKVKKVSKPVAVEQVSKPVAVEQVSKPGVVVAGHPVKEKGEAAVEEAFSLLLPSEYYVTDKEEDYADGSNDFDIRGLSNNNNNKRRKL